jgi:large repetitive protein
MSDPVFVTQSSPYPLNVFASAKPKFVDIDGNGTLDAFVTNFEGSTLFFKNTGTNTTPAFAAPVTNPLGITNVGDDNSLTFVDIDGNGTLDAFAGNSAYPNIFGVPRTNTGNTLFFNNTGTNSNPAFAPAVANPFGFPNYNVVNFNTLTFVDIDGNGTLDAFGGNIYGNTLFFRNTGTNSNPAFAAPTTNPFGITYLGGNTSISDSTFVDINGDGTLDAFIGTTGGDTLFFKNTGTNSNPAFAAPATNPFGISKVMLDSSPTFVDIDGDGDLDGFIGDGDGKTRFFRNTGTTNAPAFVPTFTPVTNPFGLIDVGENSHPTFVDIDGNGTLDAFVGSRYTGVVFLKNTGVNGALSFAPPVTEPFGFSSSGSLNPTFVDINGDGKLDAFSENVFFQNTGTTTLPAFAPPVYNSFGLARGPSAFADIDGDGKFDAFVLGGESIFLNGDTLFYKNIGTTTAPVFATAMTNPFGLTPFGNSGATQASNLTLVDVDRNGTLDAVFGKYNGDTLFFRNTGTTTTPAFAPAITNPFGIKNVSTYSSPTFVDIHGKLDAFVGSKYGDTIFFENTVPATTTRNDFNGDRKSDILWRNDNGSIALWQMNGSTVAAANLTSTSTLDPSWKTAGTGDFDGDGKSDILWRNDNGSIALWRMNGATVVSSNLTSTPSLPTSWKTAGTGDFDGDGKSDILWRNDNGSIALWQMNGATVVSSSLTSTPSLPTSWKTAGTGDFDGDGKSDILWRNDNGSIALWQMNGATVVASSLTSTPSLDNSWKINGTGDFNGDGKSDILWRNDLGGVVLWQMNGASIVSSSFTSTPSVDNSWKITGTGDFNGDGKSDILWRNDLGTTSVWQMNGANVVSASLTSVPSVDSSWKIAAPLL